MTTPRLVGRDEAAARLHGFVRAAANDGGALLVVGDPGVGKTALLDVAADLATARGTRVLHAEGVEFETAVSHAALNQLLVTVTDGLKDLSALHRSALTVALGLDDGPTPDRLVVANAVLALLRRLAAEQPVLVIVDDLPWVDRASAFVLGFVARRLRGTRIAFLAGQRSGDESFLERAGMDTLDLNPLDDEQASTLVRARFPDLAPPVVSRLVAESQGIPLALLELPRELSRHQRSPTEDLPTLLPLGRHLQTVFASRVTALPAASRAVVLMAALEGGLPHADRYWPTGDGDDLAPAEHARLLTVDPTTRRLAFTHPLIRSAVVGMATAGERRAAHRRLAEFFATDPDTRARHLGEATVEPDENVALLLEEAAYRILRRGDARAAVVGLLRAAELGPDGTARARRLSEAAYVGADSTGAIDDVSPLLARARLADPDADESLTAAVATAYLLLSDGDVETAHRLLTGAITSAAGHAGDHLMEEAHYTLLMLSFFGALPEYWSAFRTTLRRWQNPSPILAISAGTLADPARSTREQRAQLDAAITALHTETDPNQISRVAVAAIWVDRLEDCRTVLGRLATGGTRADAGVPAVRAQLILAVSDFMAGRWQESDRMRRQATEHLERKPFPMLLWTAWHAEALLAAGQGDESRCAELCERMRQWSTPRGLGVVDRYVAQVAGLCASGRGDFDTAFHHYASISPPGTFAPHEPFALWVLMDLVEAAERSGRHAAAVAHVEAARAAGIAAISSRLALLCAASEAIVADDDTASEAFERALRTPDSDQWLFDRARIELAYGEHLRRIRSIVLSRLHLQTALTVFHQLGAVPWQRRAQSELNATSPTRQPTDSSNPSDLTPQELEIALLGAKGLTNRQIAERLFISPRTVSAHLYRIFPKLGIGTRAGLRDALSLSTEQHSHPRQQPPPDGHPRLASPRVDRATQSKGYA
ncbi:helix-turn-helix transcriptional regulator [Streptomyces prunicolor]